MEMINRDGRTYFVPVGNSDLQTISSFSKWEQAFRVFSNIYTRRHPQRSGELIQKNHIIHTASLTFTWENVYLYDRDFRLHISRYPQRSWTIILQQAWTMHLKERNHLESNRAKFDRKSQKSSRDVCWCYTKGRCSYGAKCKFEHKCGICNKFGHGASSCRKITNAEFRRNHDSENRKNFNNFDRRDRDSWDRRDTSKSPKTSK